MSKPITVPYKSMKIKDLLTEELPIKSIKKQEYNNTKAPKLTVEYLQNIKQSTEQQRELEQQQVQLISQLNCQDRGLFVCLFLLFSGRSAGATSDSAKIVLIRDHCWDLLV